MIPNKQIHPFFLADFHAEIVSGPSVVVFSVKGHQCLEEWRRTKFVLYFPAFLSSCCLMARAENGMRMTVLPRSLVQTCPVLEFRKCHQLRFPDWMVVPRIPSVKELHSYMGNGPSVDD
jgi:hypothetical protein